MREILFRGKRIDNGEWVEGALLQCDDGVMYIATSMLEPPEDGGPAMVACHMVDGNTVGQYTGVNDKNGKRIFEGNIVKNYFSKRFDPIVGHVAFDGRYCRLRLYSCTGGSESGFYRGCVYEVIGNIHDNPELLEVN